MISWKQVCSIPCSPLVDGAVEKKEKDEQAAEAILVIDTYNRTFSSLGGGCPAETDRKPRPPDRVTLSVSSLFNPRVEFQLDLAETPERVIQSILINAVRQYLHIFHWLSLRLKD